MTFEFTLPKPIDAHVHLRDGAILQQVAPFTARQFSYAIVMPNLNPPVLTTVDALAYQKRVLSAAKSPDFAPLMTLYMTDSTPLSEVKKAKDAGIIGIKLYPENATTNSEFGVTEIKKTYPLLAEMEKHGMPILIHGEVTDANIDIFDREAVFIETILTDIIKKFPALKISLEHLTTKQAVDFILEQKNTFASITAHHLLYNRNEIFKGGIRPHWYCLPVLKREEHRKALVKAATSGSKKFYAGTDSAPHIRANKESSCGCAGCFTAPNAVELYATAFDSGKELPKKIFSDFMYENAREFYNIPPVKSQITLRKSAQKSEGIIADIVPLLAGQEISWQVVY